VIEYIIKNCDRKINAAHDAGVRDGYMGKPSNEFAYTSQKEIAAYMEGFARGEERAKKGAKK